MFYGIIFTSDHQTFCGLFESQTACHQCINHDIVIGLCSELVMRLFYYIHPGYGKKIGLTWVLLNVSRQLYPWTRALTLTANVDFIMLLIIIWNSEIRSSLTIGSCSFIPWYSIALVKCLRHKKMINFTDTFNGLDMSDKMFFFYITGNLIFLLSSKWLSNFFVKKYLPQVVGSKLHSLSFLTLHSTLEGDW